MNKTKLTNFLVGILLILLAMVTENTFMTPVLITLGVLNLSLSFNLFQKIKTLIKKK